MFLSRAVNTQLNISAGQLEKLARARRAFEDKVVEHASDETNHDQIYSMGPGSQKVYGYYPVGKSDSRFLAYTLDNWETLLYQRIEGKRAKRIWRLLLRKSTGKSKFTGTLALMLQRHNVEVSGHIPASARKALNQTFKFAAYGYDGESNLYAWTINADGSLGPEYRCDGYTERGIFPIVPEESAALGLGTKGWPPDCKFQIRH